MIIVTASAVTSTTNMTGFLTCTRGSNFHIESTSARLTISLSHRLAAFRCSAMRMCLLCS